MKWVCVVVVAALLQACGGGDDADTAAATDQSCSIDSQRQSLGTFMQAKYYWYRDMPAPDESAATMDGYFQSMLYRPPDRYSYTQPTAAFDQVFTQGRRIGYGYTLVWGDASQSTLRVRNVEPLSPVAAAGLRRGDTIIAIDSYSPSDIAQGLLPAVTTAGVPRTFVVLAAGAIRQITVDSADFPLQQVAATNIFDAQGSAGPEKVAYLAYNQFVSYSEPDVDTAFAQFAAAGVSDIILDLRYNGGGSIAVSRDLASLVGGAKMLGKVFAELRFNDQQSASDEDMLFMPQQATDGTPLRDGVPRVFVLTSGGTASASELLINGLRAYMPVVLVGETTYGKPYGFIPRDACGTNYEAVQFESFNGLGAGGFTSGMPPDCQVADDLDHQL
ncbi:MAG TPA: S41 family peptidase, partial [Ramlibacter sp.]|nr:S41 family peptidase [Ramlibacter sp.]